MSDPASKWLGHYSTFRVKNAKLSYKGTENVAIYAFSSGKILNVRVYACVKDLTNIMSANYSKSFYRFGMQINLNHILMTSINLSIDLLWI